MTQYHHHPQHLSNEIGAVDKVMSLWMSIRLRIGKTDSTQWYQSQLVALE